MPCEFGETCRAAKEKANAFERVGLRCVLAYCVKRVQIPAQHCPTGGREYATQKVGKQRRRCEQGAIRAKDQHEGLHFHSLTLVE